MSGISVGRPVDKPKTRQLGQPRLGFLGVGWIGRARLQALIEAGAGQVVAVSDPDQAARGAALALAPGAEGRDGLEGLLECELDGLVIATPSAAHAEQARLALERGVAVFCQKPLARTAAETEAVIETARRADRLLGVDLSYRHTRAMAEMRDRLTAGELGQVYAAELVFHNAYGPDKEWFTDRHLSGGGCVIDLATHLVDLALWLTGGHGAEVAGAVLRRRGAPVPDDGHSVEDHALAHLSLDGGIETRLACSWFLPAGRECQIECTLVGTEAALSVLNVGGSFYDLRLELRCGTETRTLVEPPDGWGGRALIEWTERLGRGERFDGLEAERHLNVARVIDDIYAAGGTPR